MIIKKSFFKIRFQSNLIVFKWPHLQENPQSQQADWLRCMWNRILGILGARPTAGAASQDDSIGGSTHSDKASEGAVIRTLR